MGELAFCVHGHFYQPVREDPINGTIPDERGAMPFRNWNELIFNHCYKPNAELGNFERISFNFGPTLFRWMEEQHPDTYRNIIEQDRRNYEKYGVGNALAQSYHHTILPLASSQDKQTQIRWGIADYEHRFGHKPSGMWLPEAAVDLESLTIMAEMGVIFTILAPWQADTFSLDYTQPYLVDLPGGKQITVFFYQQDLSTQISFDPASTENADRFAANSILPRLKSFSGENRARFIMVASDGELYGHHQPYRDKFLAHLMNGALTERNVSHVFPALWLLKHPATEKIKIKEYTSWSCHHGVERWRGICDCTIHSDWKQSLKQAIDETAAFIDTVYVETLATYDVDPWTFRDDYIRVILGQISESEFIRSWIPNISPSDLQTISLLMRGQINRQRMYTSCGWFFDDFDRIEPINVVSYAAQALYWISRVSGKNYMEQLLPSYKKISSWRSNLNGADVFQAQWHKATAAFEV
ncbi:MAG: glycoside hydrolase [Anaerolineaceae bacterium]|nr:glycoside hydrolase [Anaerolineaceae bacterium]